MTPPLRWVFLLALVGRYAASVPTPVTVDACVSLCHPAARPSPEGVCELRAAQSVLDQARVIVSRCLNLCDRQPPEFSAVRVSCHALRSLLGDLRGCRCPSTDATMSICASVVPASLVNELAVDVVTAISPSALGGRVICALREALALDLGAEGIGLAAGCTPDRPPEDAVKPDRREERPPADRDDHRSLDGDQKTTTASSEETTIDWDEWCMNQCKNGCGGNACRCDIIP